MAYAVTCTHCGHVLFTASQIGDPEAARILAHLRNAHPDELLPSRAPTFAELLLHIRVKMAD